MVGKISGVNAIQRIGDAERDAAVGALRDHLSAGRLTMDEFDERMTSALQAKTQADLTCLFEDLPGGAPGQHRLELSIQPLTDAKASGVARPSSNWTEKMRIVAITAIWLLFLVGVFTGMVSWWQFWIPGIATAVITNELGKKAGEPKPPKQLED